MSNSEQVESRVAESVTDECIHRHRPWAGKQLILSFRVKWRKTVQNAFRICKDIYSKSHRIWIFSFADKVLEP